jgi:hypothetical protein
MERPTTRGRWTAAAAASALLAALVLVAGTAGTAGGADPPAPKCSFDEPAETITIGIVQMVGCFGKETVNGQTIYFANPDIQPTYGTGDGQIRAIDMNGFLVDGRDPSRPVEDGGLIKANATTGAIRYVGRLDQVTLPVQLYSLGLSSKTQPTKLGGPFNLNFTAPKTGSLLLEDLRFNSNNWFSKVFAGFDPALDVETPIRLSEDGKGSMDMVLRLTGIFALKGKPQSATIKVPTKVGEGARVDGFELKLEEIDGIKLIKINNLEAEYSAEEKTLGGGAEFSLPFMRGKGYGFSFEIQNAILTKATVSVSGIEVPIGAPPAGTLTGMSGGFGFKQAGNEFVLNLNAGATAEFGPKVPTPWGKVVPLEVNSTLKIGKEARDFYFLFDGGLKIFRLPAGNVFLRIHTDSGVEFGFNVGVGFPSYSNNPGDPFYIGSSVDGWIAKQKFQFEGGGRVRLFGLDIFDGRILINDKAAGACWKVTVFDGGAVYEYGAKEVKTFGIGCGLDNYREKFPAAVGSGEAVASAGQSRSLTTGPREVVMSVRGKGDAPRFRLKSADGRTFTVPKTKDVVRTKGYMIVVDRPNRVTHVATAAIQNRRWTLTPYEDSVEVMGVKTGKMLPPEKVQARIVGRGLNRTLIWSSRGNPNTRIAFTEVMRGGYEQPILITGKARGRYRFQATKGSHYGNRRLRAVVLHNGTPRQATVEDRFAVRPPGKLRGPARVNAWRNIYRANATWTGVRGAKGYVAEIAVGKKGKKGSSYRRVVGPKVRSISIPSHPGGTWAIASVQALNADGVPGRATSKRFRLAPPKSLTLKQSGRQSARSAVRRGKAIRLRVLCPINGHCQTVVALKLGSRTVGRTAYQQVPGTYQSVLVSPTSERLKRRLAAGRLNGMRVVVRQHRTGEKKTGAFGATPDGL